MCTSQKVCEENKHHLCPLTKEQKRKEKKHLVENGVHVSLFHFSSSAGESQPQLDVFPFFKLRSCCSQSEPSQIRSSALEPR